MSEPFKARDRKHGAERLRRLKEVVLNERPHSRFDFNHVVNGSSYNMYRLTKGERNCGTCGCLVGHAPFAFPDHFQFIIDAGVGYIRAFESPSPFDDWTEYCEEFFSMDHDEVMAAFHPFGQSRLGFPELSHECSAEDACHGLDLMADRLDGVDYDA